jgi:outer membrane receptor protein involved in Fe transport
VYASYSQGFRSGFPQDLSVPANAVPPVSPDRLRNYEIGSKGSFWDGRIAYDASVYYMDWEGIQQSLSVYSPAYQQQVTAVVNSQSASGIGSDLALSAMPLHGLTLQGSVSWNDLKLDSDVISGGSLLFHKGDRPNSSPELTASASADYAFALGGSGYRGRVAIGANYTSSQDYRGVGSILLPIVQKGDPMTFTHASLSVEAPSHWTATLFGDNLNNEQGAPVRAFIGTPNWDARVRPRTIGLQLDYRFQ